MNRFAGRHGVSAPDAAVLYEGASVLLFHSIQYLRYATYDQYPVASCLSNARCKCAPRASSGTFGNYFALYLRFWFTNYFRNARFPFDNPTMHVGVHDIFREDSTALFQNGKEVCLGEMGCATILEATVRHLQSKTSFWLVFCEFQSPDPRETCSSP